MEETAPDLLYCVTSSYVATIACHNWKFVNGNVSDIISSRLAVSPLLVIIR